MGVTRRLGALALACLMAGTVAATLASPAAAAVVAPTSVTATRGAGNSVNVGWAVAAGATAYTVRAYTSASGRATWDVCGAPSGSSTACSGTDPLHVPRTSAAWIEVEATDGSATADAPRVPLPALPAAPAAPSLASTSGGLTVTWSWSAAGDGVAPTSFRATAYATVSGGTSAGSCTASGASATSCPITGLDNGTTYYVDVQALGADGASDVSPRTAGAPTGPPSAPASIDAQGGDAVVTVTWTGPATDGGSPVTGYLAELFTSESGGSSVASCEPATLSAMRCSIEGLENGTLFFVSVTARNAGGSGPASARVSVSAGSKPSAPRSVEVTRGDGTLDVAWLAPSSDGGSAITRYTANAFTSSSMSAVPAATCVATGLSCTIGGVANGTTYYVSVVATTATGDSQPSTRVTVRASGAPSEPRSVTAARGNGFSRVSWRAPLSTNGSTITKYIARAYRTASSDEVLASCSPLDSALRCDLGPLPNGSTYYVDVVAMSARFTSPPSSPRVEVLTGTAPDAPRDVVARQDGTSVSVRWRVPVSDGGRPITQYTATAYSSANGADPVGSCSTSGDACAITGLEGPPVYVSVTAASSMGTSTESAPRMKVIVRGAPSVPRDVAAARSGSTVRVSWLRSADDGGVPIAQYVVIARDQAERTVGTCSVPTPKGPLDQRLACAIRGARAASTVVVGAVNATTTTQADPVLLGKQATPGSTKGSTATVTPRGVTVLPAERAVVAEVARSSQEPAGATYVVQAWSKERGGAVRSTCRTRQTDAVPSCTLTDLANYEPVWIDAAVAGMGRPTPRVRIVPMASVPSVPRLVTATPGPAGLVVRWQRPLADGGYPIQDSIVIATDAAKDGRELARCIAKAPRTSCTLTGIAGEYAYVTVQSTNPVGPGAISSPLGRNLR